MNWKHIKTKKPKTLQSYQTMAKQNQQKKQSTTQTAKYKQDARDYRQSTHINIEKEGERKKYIYCLFDTQPRRLQAPASPRAPRGLTHKQHASRSSPSCSHAPRARTPCCPVSHTHSHKHNSTQLASCAAIHSHCHNTYGRCGVLQYIYVYIYIYYFFIR